MGGGGLLGQSAGRKVKGGSTWRNIVGVGKGVEESGVPFLSSFRRVVGCGSEVRFWVDRWMGSGALAELFPRLFRLALNPQIVIRDLGRWEGVNWVWVWEWRREPRGREEGELRELEVLLEGWAPGRGEADKWEWALDRERGFSVGKLRKLLSEKSRIGGERDLEPTGWCAIVPRKVNIFIWRLKLGRIPTREVLDKMGIDLDSILCPKCSDEIEDVDHVFLRCEGARGLWARVGKWWNKYIDVTSSISQSIQEDYSSLNSAKFPWWIGVKWIFLYLIWSQRNREVFGGAKRDINEAFFEWQRLAYEWICARTKNRKIDWLEWLTGNLR